MQQIIKEAREQLQEDLITYLDGLLPQEHVDDVCDLVVKNFERILNGTNG